MTTRTFDRAPATLPKLLKAALPALPVIGGLPGVKHTGDAAPDLVLELKDVSTDKEHLARYNAICGYQPADILPPLYPHFAAFGLHLSLMTDTTFPFAPMGVVHLRNRLGPTPPDRPGRDPRPVRQGARPAVPPEGPAHRHHHDCPGGRR